MKILLKIVLPFILLTSILLLEYGNSIGSFPVILLIAFIITLIINWYKNEKFYFRYVLIFSIISILPAYLIFYEIQAEQTDTAFGKISYIKLESLTGFYATKDINIIPKESRYTWIGIQYKRINIVEDNFSGKIRAVGWKGDNVFAYYDIDKKKYTGSYH